MLPEYLAAVPRAGTPWAAVSTPAYTYPQNAGLSDLIEFAEQEESDADMLELPVVSIADSYYPAPFGAMPRAHAYMRTNKRPLGFFARVTESNVLYQFQSFFDIVSLFFSQAGSLNAIANLPSLSSVARHQYSTIYCFFLSFRQHSKIATYFLSDSRLLSHSTNYYYQTMLHPQYEHLSLSHECPIDFVTELTSFFEDILSQYAQLAIIHIYLVGVGACFVQVA